MSIFGLLTVIILSMNIPCKSLLEHFGDLGHTLVSIRGRKRQDGSRQSLNTRETYTDDVATDCCYGRL